MKFKIVGIILSILPVHMYAMELSKETKLRALQHFTSRDCAQYKAAQPAGVRNRNQQTAWLSYALDDCNVQAAKQALAHGADICAGNPLRRYCEALATNFLYGVEITQEHHELVAVLIAAGARVNESPMADGTPSVEYSNSILYVMQFCTRPDCCVQRLVDAGADVNVPAQLPSAFATKNPDAVKMLLAAGARADAQVNCGTYFHKILEYSFVAEVDQWAVLDMLLQHGATMKPNQDGNTPLHEAVLMQNSGAIAYFLKHQTVNNERDLDGNTALHLSIEACDFPSDYLDVLDDVDSIVKQIVDAGVDLDVPNDTGNTALHLAIEQGSVGVIDLLLSHTVPSSLDVRDAVGNTALHIVINERYPTLTRLERTELRHRIVSRFIQAGVDVNAYNSEGLAPLHLAIQLGDYPSIELLLAHKANVLLADWRGRTPLDLAQLKAKKEGQNVVNAAHILECITRAVSAKKEAHE